MSKKISAMPYLKKYVADSKRTKRRKTYVPRGRRNYDDVIGTTTEINTANDPVSLTGGISQGVGAGKRVDDTVTLRNLYGRLIVSVESTAASKVLNYVRIVIFKWLVDSAVDSPGLTDLFEDTASNPYNSNFVAPPQERRKFKVLMDRLVYISTRADGDGNPTKIIKVNLKKGLGKIRYNEAATTGYGHIYIAYLGNNATGNDCAQYVHNLRILYNDT